MINLKTRIADAISKKKENFIADLNVNSDKLMVARTIYPDGRKLPYNLNTVSEHIGSQIKNLHKR
jgi:hypothetical protein